MEQADSAAGGSLALLIQTIFSNFCVCVSARKGRVIAGNDRLAWSDRGIYDKTLAPRNFASGRRGG